MSDNKLQAEIRTEFGKGAARRTRRSGKVPAVLYGHGGDPIHVTLPGHDTMLALKHGGANALLTLDIEGEEQLVLAKQVQRHAIRPEIEHVDLLIVERGEKVVVDVPILVVGEAEPGTLVTMELPSISLEAEATHLPETIEVSVEGAQAGSQFVAGDLTLPQGAVLQTDPDALIVHVTIAPVADVETDTSTDEDAGQELTAE